MTNDEITKRDVFREEKTQPSQPGYQPTPKRLTYRDILSRMFWERECDWTNGPTILTVRLK